MEYIAQVFASVGVLVSIVALLSARRSEQMARSLAERSQVLAELGYVNSYSDRMQSWAGDVIGSASDAIQLCMRNPADDPSAYFYEYHRLQSVLSALLDSGRLFLPNHSTEVYGTHKDVNHGLRRDALNHVHDLLIAARGINFKDRAPNAERRDALVAAKKRFVEEMKGVLDVTSRFEEAEWLSRQRSALLP